MATLVWFNVELKIRVAKCCCDNTFNPAVLDGRSAAAAVLLTDVALREIFENLLRRFNIMDFLQFAELRHFFLTNSRLVTFTFFI